MKKLFVLVLLLGLLFNSCKDYLDVVPDDVATIDNAFSTKTEAEKYLFTCYSYLPREPDMWGNVSIMGGDEFWGYWPHDGRLPANAQQIAMGMQNVVNPFMNFWDGENSGSGLFKGIRDCNIFLDNIHNTVDLDDYTKLRWISEVQFIKAYFHFYLLRMYGPIPIIDKNLPISASAEEVRVYRKPVDEVVDYIVNLMDTAAANLPMKIESRASEMGRITKPIVLSIKAKVLVTAASPLFNGNSDYQNFKGPDGVLLFNTTYDNNKWVRAAVACKEAIDICDSVGCQLYTFYSGVVTGLSDTLKLQMSIRNSICEKWNQEIIWGSTNGSTEVLQSKSLPRLDPTKLSNESPRGELAPTLKMAEMFYSEHGVPIIEDKNWDYANMYKLRTATATDKYYLQPGYQTVGLHFNREPRFYADLGFDGSIWYMMNGSWNVQCKSGQNQARKGTYDYSVTGYYAKKLVSWQFVIGADQNWSTENYSWPIIRLSDLYLLYAEALNESEGPTVLALTYINKIRERAGLKSVEESWTNYSYYPTKYTTQSGFRDIIHQERLIELAMEGHRFWDIRRWKTAATVQSQPIYGWDIEQASASNYYRKRLLFNQQFIAPRDYFWPIKENDIVINRNLVQNLGW